MRRGGYAGKQAVRVRLLHWTAYDLIQLRYSFLTWACTGLLKDGNSRAMTQRSCGALHP